jgi:hypothetical protein
MMFGSERMGGGIRRWPSSRTGEEGGAGGRLSSVMDSMSDSVFWTFLGGQKTPYSATKTILTACKDNSSNSARKVLSLQTYKAFKMASFQELYCEESYDEE